MTPLNVHSYLPIEQERKLAVALAPVTSSTHASHGDNEGNTGENNDGSEALAVSEEEFLEAATAGNYFIFHPFIICAAVRVCEWRCLLDRKSVV